MSVAFINPYLKPPPAPPPSDQLADISPSQFVFDTEGVGGNAYAGFEVNLDGTLYRATGAQPNALEDWLLSGDAAAFEVRATITSGAALELASAATDAWLPGNATHLWYLETSAGLKETRLLIEWRDAETLTVLDSCSVWLNVEVT